MTTASPKRDGSEMTRIVDEEERVLTRVQRSLAMRRTEQRTRVGGIDYDAELLSLRDQIREARLEDIPPLIEEMERLAQVAARRAQVSEGYVDAGSPYFGRLVLEEDDKRREVLIGRSTWLDRNTGIRIVDWRDAPVSRVYYRYEEGDVYEETFGGRDVEGEVVVRRSLQISLGQLRRVGTPQGTFSRRRDGSWRELQGGAGKLGGGQGTAMRPESHHRPGRLGVGEGDLAEDKTLSEITALIDPRQFEIITQPTTGLVVIQGGAGSGKTTIGLHRLAFLAFQEPQRFRPDRMLVVVFNDALVRYIGRVLPALGVEGVKVVTFEKWARRIRAAHVPDLPDRYAEDTPQVVVRFKKHPVLLHLLEAQVAQTVARVTEEVLDTAKVHEGGGRVIRVWRQTEGAPLGSRLRQLTRFLDDPQREGGALSLEVRHSVGRLAARELERAQDLVSAWTDLLTDEARVRAAFAASAPDAFTERELEWALSYCTRRCAAALAHRDQAGVETSPEERAAGVDGEDEVEVFALDDEDDALLLRLYQLLVGPVRNKQGNPLVYEHVFVDEAQDLSPTELSCVLDVVSEGNSVTLAGDVAQRLYMDNGFTDWKSVLGHLGQDHVEIEPLRLSYRSTKEIMDFATEVLGPLRNEVEGRATRTGAPVELFRFGTAGEAVGFLGDALRDLVRTEPMASIAVIARYPEQADEYHRGLVHSEVPNLRRVAEQDFPFRPGVDVTDVRQVKGLEFDYVVLVDVSTASFPRDDEARHLLHIAATRAAHQLWVLSTGTPSQLLPEPLVSDA